MTGRQDVCVTGLGLVTPAGDGWAPGWERVCKGLPTAVLAGEQETVPAHLACRVGGFDPVRLGGARARRPDRSAQLALLAAREALADARLDPARWDGARVAVIVGSGTGGAQTLESEHRALLTAGPQDMSPYAVPAALGNSLAAQLTIEFGVSGASCTVNTACASGATALGMARDLLALDRCDIALAGGADAAITPFYVAGFDRIGALSHRFDDPTGAPRAFDRRRDGFVIGEGPGCWSWSAAPTPVPAAPGPAHGSVASEPPRTRTMWCAPTRTAPGSARPSARPSRRPARARAT